MTTAQRVPVGAPIVGIRLHGKSASPGTPQAAKVAWLLSLDAREKQRAADAAALQAISRAVQLAIADMPAAVGGRLDEIGGIAVELGLAIAREIVGNALDRGFVDPTPTVARCLRDCVHGSDRGDLVVRLHPADLELVRSQLAKLPELVDEVAASRLVADATVARGAVRAETETGRLRYDPREALERVSAEVRREVTS
jgi:flagellar biosynthesis/type III secretory pathway protein FliH